MANPIALAGVVVIQGDEDENFEQLQRWHLMTPQINFGDGTSTYDTYGIPLPPLPSFRLKTVFYRIHSLEALSPIDGKIYKYDPTVRAANPVAPNGTIRIFTGGTEFSGAVPVTSLVALIIGA